MAPSPPRSRHGISSSGPHSQQLKDFFYHLGIVTLGILIALGLEQVVEARHRVKIGRESMDSFRHELIDNRGRVNEIMGTLPKVRAQIDSQIAQVAALGEGAAKTHAPIDYPDVHFLLMSSAAWDTAIAIQALYYIPPTTPSASAAPTARFRIFMDEERSGLATWQDLRGFGVDAATLSPEQRRAFIEQLHRYESYTRVIEMIGQATLTDCEHALSGSQYRSAAGLMKFAVEVIGWAGAVLILGAYALLSANKLRAESVSYQLMNILGAAGFVINSGYNGALPSAVMNVVWIGIGVYALYQLRRRPSHS